MLESLNHHPLYSPFFAQCLRRHRPIKERKPRTVTSFNNLTLWFLFNFQVEIEGLTGEIRFNDDGRRHNYTLHVVEMTVNSAMVKVNIFFFFSFLGISYSLFHHYLYTKISNHISRSRGKREENIKITQKKRNVAIKFSFFTILRALCSTILTIYDHEHACTYVDCNVSRPTISYSRFTFQGGWMDGRGWIPGNRGKVHSTSAARGNREE